ncbi:unannotated protein [freshwater metagenome]|uniref:Unannotated protein n=1 Tax=freshwater metagenome TaxID=449393 RepID=A0A6J6E6K3_9ZZZZ|nr:hypothetical protein [Actinomycetota bacterium]
MKFNRLGAFTLGVVITAVSVSAVSFANAAGDKQLNACANKKTGVIRYIPKGSCNKKTETTLSWNQMGPQGLPGSAGIKGDAGIDGRNYAVKISELRTCGDDGATLCAVGVKGPGGGLIFFVDYDNQYPDFDYLEAAPSNAEFVDGSDEGTAPDTRGPWAIGLPIVCRPESEEPCSTDSIFSGTREDEVIAEVNARGIFAGKATSQLIISKHPGQQKNGYAAGVADEYVSPVFRGETKSDWFLPSAGAMALIQVNLIENGLGNFSITSDGYWTSSPMGAFPQMAFSWDTYQGQRNLVPVSEFNPVRPMRAF